MDLREYYNKHIKNRRFYRVYSAEYEEDIKEHGLTPKKNPYRKLYPRIKKLFRVLRWLEKHHTFEHTQMWGRLVDSEKIISTTLNDMKNNFIDFTPFKSEVEYYQNLMKGKGGAIVSTVKLITNDILERKPKLPWYASYKFIKKMNDWTIERGKHDIKVLYVLGSCEELNTAFFQTRNEYKHDNLPSPYGSFEHFKKIINEHGLEKYKKIIEGKRNTDETFVNLRMTSLVPRKEIHFI
ncbi:hypothetical protein KY334_07615 [Candidatus Woesearchaeota archaeon]|nr:hypothetical protein [Candidatus Woesearchaeota archaeon]